MAGVAAKCSRHGGVGGAEGLFMWATTSPSHQSELAEHHMGNQPLWATPPFPSAGICIEPGHKEAQVKAEIRNMCKCKAQRFSSRLCLKVGATTEKAHVQAVIPFLLLQVTSAECPPQMRDLGAGIESSKNQPNEPQH